jgi:general nucleoside transport system permease protein
MTSQAPIEIPRWIDLVVLPLFNLALAFAVSAIVLIAIGQSPWQVLTLLVKGAFGTATGVSYTLYYTTTFVFTGLAVAVAYHCGLFNIGAEGQAMMGGLGAALAALALGPNAPAWLVLPAMALVAVALGVLWAAIPGALQAWRGSHIVITTIMFNFIAASLLIYLLVGVLKEPGNMSPETRAFGPAAQMPGMHAVLAMLGIEWPRTPLNATLLLAIAALIGVQLLLWRTRLGYALRAVGNSPQAALYAGIEPKSLIVVAMAISGGLAGLVGINEIGGVHNRLIADFVAGAGFAGIAVSLIGRNHPFGIALSALLFGALYQGGAELAFEIQGFSRDMVFTLQGLIVLFAGAMAQVAAPWLTRAWWALRPGPGVTAEPAHG